MNRLHGGERRASFSRRWPIACLVVLALGVVPSTAAETCSPPCSTRVVREKDELWVISTRHLDDCPDCDESPTLCALRRSADCKWNEAPVDQLWSPPAAGGTTRVWVHGNRVSWGNSLDIGMTAYHALVAADEPPVRFVIWSWPADQIKGQVRDIRVKEGRTDGESYYLASFLRRSEPASPTSLVGYSYGSRIITGATHLVAGGDLSGLRLGEIKLASSAHPADGGKSAPPAYRIATLAAALHEDWLLPGAYHGRALERTEKLLNAFNPCDRVLKWYRKVLGCGYSDAAGYIGLAEASEHADRIEQLDVSSFIGEHDWRIYLGSETLTGELRRFLMK
jgi:hypothetical protein